VLYQHGHDANILTDRPQETSLETVVGPYSEQWRHLLQFGPSMNDEPNKTRRFVVLRHVDREGTHFDLMIESGERLATWKGGLPPESCQDAAWKCRRIGDHRREYLEYEGPVSGDRGEVFRHDWGECVVEEFGATVRVNIGGRKLSGQFDLRQTADQGWLLFRV
jgi:hypothetical protein